jgi:signal transduction histidine kinase
VRIEVLRNKELILSTYLQAINNANKWDYFAETKSLSLLIPFAIESLKKALIDAKCRGAKLRFITEITKDNIFYCIEAMKIAELRHLDGVKGSFAVSDTEYIATAATASLTEVGSDSISIPYAVYSNVNHDIRQQNYVFEILWNKAILAEQKIKEIEGGGVIENTEVLYGTDNVMSAELRFFSQAKTRIDTCMDYTRPLLAIGIEQIRRSFGNAKNRGVKLRYLTEITSDNLTYCKEIMKTVDELRHLDSIKGNFMISESEYLAPSTSYDKTKQSESIIFSNVKEIVGHQQYVFDTFWSKAIPAEQRIRELEEGIAHYDTRIIEDSQEIVKEISRLTASSNELYTCLTPGGMQYSYNHFFEIKKKLLEKKRAGKHKGIKYITNIENGDVKLVKRFLEEGIQIRHVKNLPPVSFGVSDKEIAATIEKMEGGKMVQSLLLSNEAAYVNHFRSIFEELWYNGIDAAERMKDLERGVQSDIEVIPNSAKAKEVYLNLVKNAKEEIMIIFPTTRAFIRQSKLGIIELAKEAARLRDTKVRILMPASSLTDESMLDLKKDYPRNIDVRYYVEQTSAARATILVVDRKDSLVMELRDDLTSTFEEAIGFSIRSNSRPGVLSYVAIFENLWIQTEIFEELKVHDRMQREFINVAAHELRTPIQPILGLTEILRSQIKDVKHREMLDVTIRNAKRLQRLTEDILDVTKIETKTLDLKKEPFVINELIANAITDYNNLIAKKNKGSNLTLQLIDSEEHILVEADKGRITQVISNLLSNAIKFTNKGSISVGIKRKEKGERGKEYKERYNEEVIVSVKDTGAGIDPTILPRLFTKFATKSAAAGGTGLGLFISKSIVEAHGGKTWAENNRGLNKGDNGATFYFTLPILTESPVNDNQMRVRSLHQL